MRSVETLKSLKLRLPEGPYYTTVALRQLRLEQLEELEVEDINTSGVDLVDALLRHARLRRLVMKNIRLSSGSWQDFALRVVTHLSSLESVELHGLTSFSRGVRWRTPEDYASVVKEHLIQNSN